LGLGLFGRNEIGVFLMESSLPWHEFLLCPVRKESYGRWWGLEESLFPYCPCLCGLEVWRSLSLVSHEHVWLATVLWGGMCVGLGCVWGVLLSSVFVVLLGNFPFRSS
jgi:hypothetical protein